MIEDLVKETRQALWEVFDTSPDFTHGVVDAIEAFIDAKIKATAEALAEEARLSDLANGP